MGVARRHGAHSHTAQRVDAPRHRQWSTIKGGRTVDCINAGGILYDITPIDGGASTCGKDDANSCPDGTDIWVPRSLEHATAVWNEYGDSYIHFVGIYRPADGCGTCDFAAAGEAAYVRYVLHAVYLPEALVNGAMAILSAAVALSQLRVLLAPRAAWSTPPPVVQTGGS